MHWIQWQSSIQGGADKQLKTNVKDKQLVGRGDELRRAIRRWRQISKFMTMMAAEVTPFS